MIIISLGMIDLYDRMGIVVGCAMKDELNNDDGKPQATAEQ
jgi:hypothetical protein